MFVVTCLLLVAGGIVLITGYTSKETVQYWVEFRESVLGLGSNSPVAYLGVPVGNVSNIYVTDGSVAHVEMEIFPDKVTLHEGVEAKLVLYSLATGTMAISLSGGQADGPVLPQGSQIPTTPSLVETVSSQVEGVLATLDDILGTFRDGLSGVEEGDLAMMIQDAGALIARGQEFLANGSEALSEVRKQASTGIDGFNELVVNVQDLVKETNQTVVTVREKVAQLEVNETEKNVNKLVTNVSDLAERLNQTAEKLEEMVAATANHTANVEYNFSQTLQNLNDTLRSVRDLADTLEQDPSALVRGRGTPKGE